MKPRRIAIKLFVAFLILLSQGTIAQSKLNLSFTGMRYSDYNLTVRIYSDSTFVEHYYREPKASYITYKLDPEKDYKMVLTYNKNQKTLYIPKGSLTKKKTRLLIDFKNPVYIARYEKNKLVLDAPVATQME